jgi:hypothetical protein
VGFKGDGPIPAIPDDVRVEASRRYVEACEGARPSLEKEQER